MIDNDQLIDRQKNLWKTIFPYIYSSVCNGLKDAEQETEVNTTAPPPWIWIFFSKKKRLNVWNYSVAVIYDS